MQFLDWSDSNNIIEISFVITVLTTCLQEVHGDHSERTHSLEQNKWQVSSSMGFSTGSQYWDGTSTLTPSLLLLSIHLPIRTLILDLCTTVYNLYEKLGNIGNPYLVVLVRIPGPQVNRLLFNMHSDQAEASHL